MRGICPALSLIDSSAYVEEPVSLSTVCNHTAVVCNCTVYNKLHELERYRASAALILTATRIVWNAPA